MYIEQLELRGEGRKNYEGEFGEKRSGIGPELGQSKVREAGLMKYDKVVSKFPVLCLLMSD